MYKLLIVDDTYCSEALDTFLKDYQDDIMILMDVEGFDDRIDKIISDLKRFYKMQHKSVVKTLEGLKKVAVSDILYVQNLPGKHQSLFFNKDNEKMVVLNDIHSIENDLSGFNFIRVNHDYLVNADFISQYFSETEKFILLEGGHKINVDPCKESSLLEVLNNWK